MDRRIAAVAFLSMSLGVVAPTLESHRARRRNRRQATLDPLTDVWRRGDLDGEMRFYLDAALVVTDGLALHNLLMVYRYANAKKQVDDADNASALPCDAVAVAILRATASTRSR